MTDKELTKMAKEKIERIFWKATFNAGLLALIFAEYAAEGYASGSYLTLGFSALAVYLTISDAIEFYQFRKSISIIAEGENNG